METVETVDVMVSADSIGGRDGGTTGNRLTMATVNHSSLSMALAFGIVFAGGGLAIRREFSLNLMVVVEENKNLQSSFGIKLFLSFLSPDCLLIPCCTIVFHPQLALTRWVCSTHRLLTMMIWFWASLSWFVLVRPSLHGLFQLPGCPLLVPALLLLVTSVMGRPMEKNTT